jgi:alpha-galactosidase
VEKQRIQYFAGAKRFWDDIIAIAHLFFERNRKLKKMILVVSMLAMFTNGAARADDKKIIAVNTENSSLVFMVNSQGKVFHKYFGGRLESAEDILKSLPYDPRRYETFEALSTFGNENKFEVALKVRQPDGNMTLDLRYERHEQVKVDDNVTETRILLKDEHYPFFVTLKYAAFRQEDIISSSVKIENKSDGEVLLENFASADLVLSSNEYWLTHFYGSWAGEMQREEERLGKGIKIVDSKKGVRTTQSENSAFMLSLGHAAEEEEGEVIGGALAWSGNYRLCFEVDSRNTLHLTAGMNPFGSAYHVEAGEDFETPAFIFSYSDSGKGQVSRNFHRWARKYSLRDGDKPRPIVLNSWEGAYFSFDEDTITKMITDAASMGVEMFVLDDGWFGNKYPRDNDKAGLGDWQVNKKKLPSGIDYLIDHAEKEGIKFGIWVEPEMVNPRSELAENHPEWIVQSPNREPILMRNQLLLDLSNPAVQEFVFKVVDDLLTKHPRIAYIKWDANRYVQNFGSTYLPADRQSHLWIDYTRGLYSVYERLMARHGHVIFQACASGGGRVDFGSLKYHHEFWASDNTDAYSRIFLQWNTTHIYPAIAMGAHVSGSPNHQTGNSSPLKMRFDVAMSGRLGVELQPSHMAEEELEFCKNAIAEYKRIRDVVQLGDLYRLISPYKGNRAALMYVTEDKGRAVVFAYSTRYHIRQDYPMVKLAGLDSEKQYLVREINSNSANKLFNGSGKTFGGDFLMKFGMQLKVRKANESICLELTEVK